MANLFRLVAYLLFLLSFNAKALVVNGCTIEAYTSCIGADLSNQPYGVLSGANLSNADLSGANLANSDLQYVNFSSANLSNADLSGVNMANVDLPNADLSDANLSDAFLYNTWTTTGTDLTGANLSDAVLYDGLGSADVSGAFYNDQTVFSPGFDPSLRGMIFVSEVPLPAGIYLFLSGLVGLGAVRLRK